jgi:metallo-beta-lactamase family protein
VKRIVFTGDLGRRDIPLLVDPATVQGCDVLITESTYGNRIHPPANDIKRELVRIIREAVTLGGRIVIPAFSLGRTQQVVYYLNELFNERQLPSVPIYVDSPLATRLTKVFRTHNISMDEDVRRTLLHDRDPFGFEQLTYVGSQQESMELNRREGSCVIISASGMCESGRIVHHIKHACRDERNSIVLIGYQAPHTLGRQIAERRPYLRIFDREYPLRTWKRWKGSRRTRTLRTSNGGFRRCPPTATSGGRSWSTANPPPRADWLRSCGTTATRTRSFRSGWSRSRCEWEEQRSRGAEGLVGSDY